MIRKIITALTKTFNQIQYHNHYSHIYIYQGLVNQTHFSPVLHFYIKIIEFNIGLKGVNSSK